MYVREVAGRVLTFQVSGKLWMRSLIMGDVETGSEWSHILGRAMAGPLTGTELQPLITDMVTWGVWRETHPGTSVLDMRRTSREFSKEFYSQPERFVFGFMLGDQAWALGLPEMQAQPVHQFQIEAVPFLATYDTEGTAIHLYDPRLEGKVLSFKSVAPNRLRDDQSGSVWDATTGQAISGPKRGQHLPQRVGIMSFRKAWQNFHPEYRSVEF